MRLTAFLLSWLACGASASPFARPAARVLPSSSWWSTTKSSSSPAMTTSIVLELRGGDEASAPTESQSSSSGGGGIGGVDPQTLAVIKAVFWALNGIVLAPATNLFESVFKTDKLEPLTAYCAESFAWSVLGIGMLCYLGMCTDVSTAHAIGFSSLPALYFLYKEALKGTYKKLGFATGRGPAILLFVAGCVASLIFEKGDTDLAAKLLIGLTTMSCSSSAFIPDFGAALKGVTLKEGAEKNWWAMMNKAPLEWAFLATALMNGIDATRAVGLASLFWAALLVETKYITNSDVVGNPSMSLAYLLFSLAIGGGILLNT